MRGRAVGHPQGEIGQARQLLQAASARINLE
jgi:hypothetical protein